MRFQTPEAGGRAPAEHAPTKKSEPEKDSRSQHALSEPRPALAEIAGPTYLTAQTLVQQVAYSLADRIWTYSPETFDLGEAAKRWAADREANAFGYPPGVEALEVRHGAASIALGYIFSKDFDLAKRHIPQTILTNTASLLSMHEALDQLSLLYTVANPFVAHVAAADYVGGEQAGLVTDYASAMTLADDLGLGMVASSSAQESQHMSLFATVLASAAPSVHIYDGIKMSRETTRVVDTLDQAGLFASYKAILADAADKTYKRADPSTKALGLLAALNSELGTEYGLFEYAGHNEPESVLVVFGTVESSLAKQIATSLAADDVRVGVVGVRVYRPFVEDAFLKLLAQSVKRVGVLGQVHDRPQVSDNAVQSSLYRDVLAAVTFSDLEQPPQVIDIKYPRNHLWRPVGMAAAFQLILGKALFGAEAPERPHLELLDPAAVQQYTFWDLDQSTTAVSAVIGKALATESAHTVTVSTRYDNLSQGGVHRTDIRNAKRTVDAPYSIESADTAYVGDESLLKAIDVCKSIKSDGNLVVRIAGVKDEADLEKRIPTAMAKAVQERGIHLHIFDPQKIEGLDEDAELESFVIQLAFLRVALPDLGSAGVQRLASVNGTEDALEKLSAKIEPALQHLEIPAAWVEKEIEAAKLPADLRPTSFVPYPVDPPEPPGYLKTHESVAQSIVFKEAYGARPVLRPELGHPTWTVTLREHRRLTPETYDRNIMHLDFDLGDSGLLYNIGDSLGIHPRNDHNEVMEFINRFELDPEAVVELPLRDSGTLRAFTVYQALIEYIDIFGKPGRQFYEMLASYAEDPEHAKSLRALGGPEGATEFKRRSEVDTVTFADILEEFPSARPAFHDLVRLVPPLKRREYSIASCQKVQPDTVSLMIVTVNWSDPRGRDRFGLATRYLDALRPGDRVTVSLKPSVMKLPPRPTDPIIMAGLGTGLAPFRAFVQHRAWERDQGTEIGPVLLYMGSRHQKQEYCYGEEWEAYRDAGVVTLLSCAFSRDQPQKIYIQDRMRETGVELEEAYLQQPGAFYLCGPTWPVPDVTTVLEERIARAAKAEGKKVKPRNEIERLKDEGRYVLEVY